jgi:hypothetical protein
VHEVVHQRFQLLFGLDVELVLVLGAHAVAVGHAVQGHQHDRDPDGGFEAEDEVEEQEWVRVPVPNEADEVEQDPEQHQTDLSEHEDPAADEAREIGGDAIGKGELAVDVAVEIAHRGMVVLVLDQVPRDIFDFSAD